jgi:hypothetical protein
MHVIISWSHSHLLDVLAMVLESRRNRTSLNRMNRCPEMLTMTAFDDSLQVLPWSYHADWKLVHLQCCT